MGFALYVLVVLAVIMAVVRLLVEAGSGSPAHRLAWFGVVASLCLGVGAAVEGLPLLLIAAGLLAISFVRKLRRA